jgi:general secretion pathway protein H
MSRIERHAGFTLVEVMAVMLLIALISGLAVTMTHGVGRASLKSVALETAALFRRERLNAMMSGRPRHVTLDRERREFLGESSGKVIVPREVELDVLSAGSIIGQMQRIVEFRPDGASSGVALAFARERVAYEVRVNWFTGGVSIDAH